MKIGGTYWLHQIEARHWSKGAEEAELSPDWVKAAVETLIKGVIGSLEVTRGVIAETNNSPFLKKLADTITERARNCAELIGL